MGTRGLPGAIARQDWMQPLEEGLQKLVEGTYTRSGETGRKVENFMHGTWLGHPLHVILTDIPIGTWTAAVVFDLLEAFTGRGEFGAAADTSIGIGIAGALGAAVTGATDWHKTDPPARRIGLTHALINVGGVALFASSLAARRRRSRGAGRALSALGFAGMTLGAYLGGIMVYEERVGVDHTAGQTLPENFTAILPESELEEGKPKRAEYNGVPILLVRRGGRIFALAATCSHLGGPLDEGEIKDGSVQCPWHASRFSLETGEVLDGPAVHPQPCLEVRVRNGQVEVRKSSRQPMAITAT